jgi:hypothetical protein
VIRLITATKKPVGPHTDQSARDALDDSGLVITGSLPTGSATDMTEVVG